MVKIEGSQVVILTPPPEPRVPCLKLSKQKDFFCEALNKKASLSSTQKGFSQVSRNLEEVVKNPEEEGEGIEVCLNEAQDTGTPLQDSSLLYRSFFHDGVSVDASSGQENDLKLSDLDASTDEEPADQESEDEWFFDNEIRSSHFEREEVSLDSEGEDLSIGIEAVLKLPLLDLSYQQILSQKKSELKNY